MKPTSFELLQMFHKDRPVMASANKTEGVSFLLFLLFGESVELIGEPNGFGRKKYLEQELSDIVIFSMAILDISMGYTSSNFFDKQRQLSNELTEVKKSNNVDAMVITLFSMVNKTCRMSEHSNLDQDLLRIIIFAMITLDFLMGNSDLAIKEKLARNMAKYPAWKFRDADGTTYRTAMTESKHLFTKRDNDEFYAKF